MYSFHVFLFLDPHPYPWYEGIVKKYRTYMIAQLLYILIKLMSNLALLDAIALSASYIFLVAVWSPSVWSLEAH